MLLGQFQVHRHRSQNTPRNSGSRPATQPTTTEAGPTQTGQSSSNSRSGVSALEHFRTSVQSSETFQDSMDTQFDETISQTVSCQHHQSNYSNLELSDQDRKHLKVEARELAQSTGLSSSKKLVQLTEVILPILL